MRDEKEISSQIESNADKLFGKDWLTKLAYSVGYMDGIAYADNHPNWEKIVERLREEITNDLRNDRWISVEDELPIDYEPVLAVVGGNHFAFVGICLNKKTWYCEIQNKATEIIGITHWMHLPQPPKKGGKE